MDKSNLREGDQVYSYGGLYINDEVVFREDVVNMSYDELQEFRDELLELVAKGKRSRLIYDMLIISNSEFSRRS